MPEQLTEIEARSLVRSASFCSLREAGGHTKLIGDSQQFILTIAAKADVAPGITNLDIHIEFIGQIKREFRDNIYTCTNDTTPYAITGLYTSCRTQLVVNGAFVAQKTYLDRTFSSRRHSLPGEKFGTGNKTCSTNGSLVSPYNDCAAEIFNFSPEMYLMRPSIPASSGPTTGRYDFITSLSPVL